MGFFYLLLKKEGNTSSQGKYMKWFQRMSIPSTANQTGGRHPTQESLQVRVWGPSDIGLIKPLRGRHQSGAAWREAPKDLEGRPPCLPRELTILFIHPRVKIHRRRRASDVMLRAGASAARICKVDRADGQPDSDVTSYSFIQGIFLTREENKNEDNVWYSNIWRQFLIRWVTSDCNALCYSPSNKC